MKSGFAIIILLAVPALVMAQPGRATTKVEIVGLPNDLVCGEMIDEDPYDLAYRALEVWYSDTCADLRESICYADNRTCGKQEEKGVLTLTKGTKDGRSICAITHPRFTTKRQDVTIRRHGSRRGLIPPPAYCGARTMAIGVRYPRWKMMTRGSANLPTPFAPLCRSYPARPIRVAVGPVCPGKAFNSSSAA